jgi:hypothetical protein
MQRISVWLILALLGIVEPISAGDSAPDDPSWSWVEKNIIENIPTSYLQHKTGIVVPPLDDDVKEATQFGISDKDNKAVEYAYLIKGPSDFWGGADVYVYVQTPLFLIADHARKKAREFRDFDDEYIAYCKTLKVAKISVVQQTYTRSWNAIGTKMQVILLRDGKRVEPVGMLRAYKGRNPYGPKLSSQLEAITENAMKNAQQHLANMSPELKEQIIAGYRAGGMSEEQIKALFGSTSSSGSSKVTSIEIPVIESDGIYAISELKKPGVYEVVFRTPPSNNIFSTNSDKEIRFAVTFEKFK